MFNIQDLYQTAIDYGQQIKNIKPIHLKSALITWV